MCFTGHETSLMLRPGRGRRFDAWPGEFREAFQGHQLARVDRRENLWRNEIVLRKWSVFLFFPSFFHLVCLVCESVIYLCISPSCLLVDFMCVFCLSVSVLGVRVSCSCESGCQCTYVLMGIDGCVKGNRREWKMEKEKHEL